MQGSRPPMSDPDLHVQIDAEDVREWLADDHPSWATATRFHARKHEQDGVVVLTATSSIGVVGYAVFDRQMTHLHYIETREDCRRRGVASRIWARVREDAVHRDRNLDENRRGDLLTCSENLL